jgi:hypothetical protein
VQTGGGFLEERKEPQAVGLCAEQGRPRADLGHRECSLFLLVIFVVFCRFSVVPFLLIPPSPPPCSTLQSRPACVHSDTSYALSQGLLREWKNDASLHHTPSPELLPYVLCGGSSFHADVSGFPIQSLDWVICVSPVVLTGGKRSWGAVRREDWIGLDRVDVFA